MSPPEHPFSRSILPRAESRSTPLASWYNTPNRVHPSATEPSQAVLKSSAPRLVSRSTYSPLSSLIPNLLQAAALPASHSFRRAIASLLPGWHAAHRKTQVRINHDENPLSVCKPRIASRNEGSERATATVTEGSGPKFHLVIAALAAAEISARPGTSNQHEAAAISDQESARSTQFK
jgi:hypothetical protein